MKKQKTILVIAELVEIGTKSKPLMLEPRNCTEKQLTTYINQLMAVCKDNYSLLRLTLRNDISLVGPVRPKKKKA